MKPETAFKAASWWTSKIGDNHDNGEKDPSNILAMALADMISIKNRPGSEQIGQFEMDLSTELMNLKEDSIIIDCDYSPDPILARVAKRYNIPLLSFPFKTSMRIENDVVTVKDGYGQSFVEI